MGENGSRRFGAYLRQLREDRGLTLDQIEEAAIAYRIQISKAYLSRCETGKIRPNLERLSVLSKIYSADLGLLIERHETEKELEQVPPIDLTGMTFDEIHAAGVQQALHGQLKSAFMTFSAAHDLAILEGGEDAAARRGEARLALSFVLSQQERYELACEEAGEVTKMKDIPEDLINRALLRLATCHYWLKRIHLTRVIVEGLTKRSSTLSTKVHADLLLLHGLVDEESGEHRAAILKARAASALYRKAKNKPGESGALHNAGLAYLSSSDPARAVTYFEKSLSISRKLELRRAQADTTCWLARAYFALGAEAKSRALLQESMELCRVGEYTLILFTGYLLLLTIAIKNRDALSKATALRSLRKLVNKIPRECYEAEEFHRMEVQGV